MNTIGKDTVQVVDYIRNNIYYNVRTRCLARLQDKAIVAVQLTIFETENKTKTTDEIMRYSGALFATYEMAIIIHPKKNYSERVFSRMGIQSYATMGGLRETVDIFIRNEFDERDQERYRAFLDLDTLEERVAKEGFIQSFFRMKSSGDWKSIRISRIPSDTESLYLYTIQSILKEENDRMNEYLLDHPDL